MTQPTIIQPPELKKSKATRFKTQFRIWFWQRLMAPFSWSRWTDIITFDFGHSAYLLQGKVNYKTNAKKFRVTGISSPHKVPDPGHVAMETLTERGLIDTETKYPI